MSAGFMFMQQACSGLAGEMAENQATNQQQAIQKITAAKLPDYYVRYSAGRNCLLKMSIRQSIPRDLRLKNNM
jgi:hypothetical protein